MSAPCGGLGYPPNTHPRVDWSPGPRGRAGRLRRRAAASAGREWEWRARPPPPCHSPPRFLPSPLPPSLPRSLLALPGSGRALAGLRIAHSGGAAVFVGWGSGLPLAAGIRVQPGCKSSFIVPTAQSRDFTVKDIIYLHPSTTPYPGGFKCFTCEKAADNYECNRWAPDIYCPRETRYCYTQHTMEVTGNSISVTKRCVPLEDCLSTGCRDSEHEGHKVCTSCCEGNICNLPLPRNETDATFATTSPINQTNGHPHCMSVIVSCLWVWLGLTL
ncbi:hypothetical protein R6Z07F_002964 [Ovis aries]